MSSSHYQWWTSSLLNRNASTPLINDHFVMQWTMKPPWNHSSSGYDDRWKAMVDFRFLPSATLRVALQKLYIICGPVTHSKLMARHFGRSYIFTLLSPSNSFVTFWFNPHDFSLLSPQCVLKAVVVSVNSLDFFSFSPRPFVILHGVFFGILRILCSSSVSKDE